MAVNVTISLPEDLYKKMKSHEEVNWSATIRNIVEQKLKDMDLLDKLTEKSKLTEEDVAALSEKLDQSVAKKLGIA